MLRDENIRWIQPSLRDLQVLALNPAVNCRATLKISLREIENAGLNFPGFHTMITRCAQASQTHAELAGKKGHLHFELLDSNPSPCNERRAPVRPVPGPNRRLGHPGPEPGASAHTKQDCP